MSSAAQPIIPHRRQEFVWSEELESPEELRLAQTPEEVTPQPPPPPSPAELRRRVLLRQIRDMVVPLIWALACVGLITAVQRWGSGGG